MIDPTQFKKALRDAINMILDDNTYLVIEEDQQAKRPVQPYTTVKMLDIQAMSQADKRITTTDVDVTLSSQWAYRIFVGIKSFRNDAILTGMKIRKGLARESVVSFLQIAGIGLAQRTDIRNETMALEHGFEERSGFNVYFNVVESDSEIYTTIDEAEVEVIYESPSGKAETIIQIKE